MEEAFEAYINQTDQTITSEIYDLLNSPDKNPSTVLTLILQSINIKAKESSGLDQYAYLYSEIRKLYLILKEKQSEFPNEYQRIYIIAYTMWELEEGIEMIIQEPIKPMIPDIDEEEEMRRLNVLDKAKEIFKSIIINAFKTLKSFTERNLIFSWAKMIYYNVYGFQAPTRNDPLQAARDALGINDHFIEMAQEIISLSTPGQ